jgi:hypothetical protein
MAVNSSAEFVLARCIGSSSPIESTTATARRHAVGDDLP